MRKIVTAAAILAMTGTSAVYAQAANLQGASSNTAYVRADTPSDFPPLAAPLGYAGLEMLRQNGTDWSGSIDLYGGPVTQVTNAVGSNANQPGPYYANFPILPISIAQVWLNNQHSAATIYSLRQTRNIPLANWPQFAGLVVGQVNGTTKGTGVYFGEWAKAFSSPSTGNSTNLNMADASHTVWYVGDNAVTSMPTAINATYNVVGISQTGTDSTGATLPGGLPHIPNLYTGQLDVAYTSSGGGTIGGGATNNSISRVVDGVTHTISFAGTTISNNGTFTNGATTNKIDGRFYNGAEALAGLYTNGTYADAAFGGNKASGTITP